jgi:hypothetical protein
VLTHIPHPRQRPAREAHVSPSPMPYPPPPHHHPAPNQQEEQPAVSSLSTQPAIMTGVPRTVTKRTKDAALEHVKKALRTKGNLLTKPEMAFVRTSCHILGVNSKTTMKVIVSRAKEKGENQPRRVLMSLHAQLEELGAGVERHKRHTPTPAFNTRMLDSMGAPARSLGNLQGCVRGLKEAIEGGYSIGIKTARIATENTIADFKVTIDRIAVGE